MLDIACHNKSFLRQFSVSIVGNSAKRKHSLHFFLHKFVCFIFFNALLIIIFDFTVNLFIIGFGIFEGSNSPMNLLFTSDATPLPSGKITTEEGLRLLNPFQITIYNFLNSFQILGSLLCFRLAQQFH